MWVIPCLSMRMVYYIYYLKDRGDSRNHSVYLATTTDFVNYTEYDVWC